MEKVDIINLIWKDLTYYNHLKWDGGNLYTLAELMADDYTRPEWRYVSDKTKKKINYKLYEDQQG